MNILIVFALAVLMALSGCAACREHPVACSVVGAVIVGSVAATVAAHHSGATPHQNLCGVIGTAGIPGHANDCAEIGR